MANGTNLEVPSPPRDLSPNVEKFFKFFFKTDGFFNSSFYYDFLKLELYLFHWGKINCRLFTTSAAVFALHLQKTLISRNVKIEIKVKNSTKLKDFFSSFVIFSRSAQKVENLGKNVKILTGPKSSGTGMRESENRESESKKRYFRNAKAKVFNN